MDFILKDDMNDERKDISTEDYKVEQRLYTTQVDNKIWELLKQYLHLVYGMPLESIKEFEDKIFVGIDCNDRNNR